MLIIPFSWGSHLDGEKPSTPRRISVRIPRQINGVGRGVSVFLTHHGSSNLLVVAFSIVANAEEVLLEASMTM
jgi:hypothetical protein